MGLVCYLGCLVTACVPDYTWTGWWERGRWSKDNHVGLKITTIQAYIVSVVQWFVMWLQKNGHSIFISKPVITLPYCLSERHYTLLSQNDNKNKTKRH